MKNPKRPGVISTAVLASMGLLILAGAPGAQRPEPEIHGVFDGDTMYTVLPPGAIPAIMEPEFVAGAEADSLWQLDAHEIVNDEIAGVAIAATW